MEFIPLVLSMILFFFHPIAALLYFQASPIMDSQDEQLAFFMLFIAFLLIKKLQSSKEDEE